MDLEVTNEAIELSNLLNIESFQLKILLTEIIDAYIDKQEILVQNRKSSIENELDSQSKNISMLDI